MMFLEISKLELIALLYFRKKTAKNGKTPCGSGCQSGPWCSHVAGNGPATAVSPPPRAFVGRFADGG
jgi:hypothetical protein